MSDSPEVDRIKAEIESIQVAKGHLNIVLDSVREELEHHRSELHALNERETGLLVRLAKLQR